MQGGKPKSAGQENRRARFVISDSKRRHDKLRREILNTVTRPVSYDTGLLFLAALQSIPVTEF